MQVVFVLFGLSLLVFWHELGHAVAARLLRLEITDISFGFGPTLRSKRFRGVRFRLGLVPFGGFVRVAQLSLEADEPGRFRPAPILSRLTVQAAGSLANFVLAALLVTASTMAYGHPTGAIAGLEVTKVSGHAREAGLRPGDHVLRINDTPVRSVRALNEALEATVPDGTATVEARRAGEVRTLRIRPLERNERRGLGARYVAHPELREVTLTESVALGAAYPIRQGRRLLRNASAMFVPASDVKPVGPVGLADRVARSGQWDARRAIAFVALLSVVVGLFNLLPLPGLDGGRLVLECVEVIRRKRVPIRKALLAQVVGALLLFAAWLALTLWEVLHIQ